MDFGLEVYDSNGVKTLGTGDFTLEKLFEWDFVSASAPLITTLTIPGYVPEKCIIVITPYAYTTSSETQRLPYYEEAGGEVVYIKRDRLDSQFIKMPNCIVEAFRVL